MWMKCSLQAIDPAETLNERFSTACECQQKRRGGLMPADQAQTARNCAPLTTAELHESRGVDIVDHSIRVAMYGDLDDCQSHRPLAAPPFDSLFRSRVQIPIVGEA